MAGIAASTWAAVEDHCWLPSRIAIDLIVQGMQLRDLQPPSLEGLGCCVELPGSSCRRSTRKAVQVAVRRDKPSRRVLSKWPAAPEAVGCMLLALRPTVCDSKNR